MTVTKLRTPAWPYALLGVALLGALSFGWYQSRLNRALALDTENSYMAAFHQLKWTSENIEERMSKLMATNDARQQENLLADLRVYSTKAVGHMAVLPFGYVNTPQVTGFLNRLRNRSDELHDKVSTGAALSQDDWNELTTLRQQSLAFESGLGDMLGLVSNNLLRWRDTARATSRKRAAAGDTPITQTLMRMDRGMGTPDPGAHPGVPDARTPGARQGQQAAQADAGAQAGRTSPMGPQAAPRVSPGPRVTPAVAADAIRRFVDQPLQGDPRLTGQSDAADHSGKLSLYFFDAVKQNGTPLTFGVSVNGGHVIYQMDGRRVTTRTFNRDQLTARAQQWLAKWGYPNAEFVSAVENAGTLMMDFAPLQNGVAIHTELIKVSLAMDNAEVVGFDARNYWINRYDRKLARPAINAWAAQKRLSPRLKVAGAPVLTVVADRRDREHLAWEFVGQYANQRYMVFVDGQTGEEINLLRISGDPSPPHNEVR